MPKVLWAYQTTSRRPTGTTYFALAYGMEVVIPTKIGMPTAKTVVQGQRDDNQEIVRQLDWPYEVRRNATIRIASYQQRVVAHYNRKARPCNFLTKSLVLRKVFENTTEVRVKRFHANWEGPYVVTKVEDSRAYHLQTLNERPLLCPWNVSNLKRYYQ